VRPSAENRGAGVRGVSVVICCHNSALRLPKTLEHLRRQEVATPWEVLLIDNASTDGTADLARKLWPSNSPAPLRVIPEPQPGLSHARQRGFVEARFEILSFVDDDNWLAPDWLRTAEAVMRDHPEVGACGGLSEGEFEVPPPPWLDRFADQIVVGPQFERGGDVTLASRPLWGAGLTIRRSAWQALFQAGFRPRLSGRKGAALASGEDYEICYALQLAGWRLWYEPTLRLRHLIPPARTKWEYLRRLNRGNGASSVGFDPYTFALRPERRLVRLFGRLWTWPAMKAAGRLVLVHGWDLVRSLWTEGEGDGGVLRAEYQIGRLTELVRRRSDYDRAVEEVSASPWLRQEEAAHRALGEAGPQLAN